MKEKELNTLIKNNFDRKGWAHKIADQPRYDKNSGQRFNLKKPFDGISMTPGNIYFWETKILTGYKAFPLSVIEEHQFEALQNIKLLTEGMCIYALIILGVYIFRVGVDLFFFDINYIKLMKDAKVKSVLKTKLLDMKADGKFLPLRKKRFEVHKVPEKIAYWT